MPEHENHIDQSPHDGTPGGFARAAELRRALAETTNQPDAPAISPNQPDDPNVPNPADALQFSQIAREVRYNYRSPKHKDREQYQDQLQELTNRYAEQHPNELEAITILGNIMPLLELKKQLDNPDISRQEKKPLFKDMTEYQYLWTHFIVANKDNPQMLNDFWQTARTLGDALGQTGQIRSFQSGIITAAGTYQVFEALGKQPHLSHPAEDAYDAIDLWVEGATNAVQIKKGHDREVVIERTDDIEFPGVEVTGKQNNNLQHFAIRQPGTDEMRFKMNVERYARRTGRNVEGYFIRLPYGKIDHTTGRPMPELIEDIRRKLPAEPISIDQDLPHAA